MNDSTDPGGTGDGFDDPTAPSWASPEPAPATQPIPTEPPVTPPSPYAAPVPPPAPAPDPYPPNPYGQNPYGQPPQPQQPYDPGPYGQQPYGQPPYGQQPYGSTAYGQPPYSMPPAPYGAPAAKNTSAVVLTVVSGLATVLCCLVGLPSLVVGIVALTRQSTDPQAAARLTRYGWVTFAVLMALAVVAVVTLGIVGSFDTSTQTDFNGL